MAAGSLLALLLAPWASALSFCGMSQRPLANDTMRRTCLRQCMLVEENGILLVKPSFSEWELYCRETTTMDRWDSDCEAFVCCTFGCGMYGEDRAQCHNARGFERWELLDGAQAELMKSMSKAERCELEKCRAYCVRETLGSCREQQFREDCAVWQMRLPDCSVDCSGAFRTSSAIAVLLFSSVYLLATLW